MRSPPDQIVSLFRSQQLDSQQQKRHTWALAAAGHESLRQNPSLTWGSLPLCPGAKLQSMVLLKASSAKAVPEALLSGITHRSHHALVYISICQSLHIAFAAATLFFPHLSSTQLRPHKCIELTAEKVGSLV